MMSDLRKMPLSDLIEIVAAGETRYPGGRGYLAAREEINRRFPVDAEPGRCLSMSVRCSSTSSPERCGLAIGHGGKHSAYHAYHGCAYQGLQYWSDHEDAP